MLSQTSLFGRDRHGRQPGQISLSLTLASLGIAGFIWMALRVETEMVAAWDRRWLLAARSSDDLSRAWGAPLVLILCKAITQLGSAVVVVGMSVGALLIWIRRGGRRLALGFAAAVGGGYGVILVLKQMYSRPRPDIVPHLVEVNSPSFPSQHSFAAMMFFLQFALMLTSERRLGFRLFASVAALLMGGMVAATRVYLGVHYPSDVVAGACAGGAWAAMCSVALMRLRAPKVSQCQ